MKIVICWTHISGYMASCWREVARLPGVELFVLAFKSDSIAPFDPAVLGEIRYRLMDEAERVDSAFVHKVVAAEKPDVLVISGWSNRGLRPLASHTAFKGVFKIMAMDTPIQFTFKQAVGRRLLRSYLRQFDRVVVPGERAFLYARYLGFADTQIRKGTYGIDYNAFSAGMAARDDAWPRQFLFVGRYVQEKGLDTLLTAYAKYRAESADPWGLTCCGRGPMAGLLAGRAGVTDLGFVSPAEQPAVYGRCGAFVLASRFEPWGVVVAEAAAAGLPLVCSAACGATAEILRDGYNGYTFAADDADGLCRRMLQIERRPDLRAWGARSHQLAGPHAAAFWPHRIFDGLLPASQ